MVRHGVTDFTTAGKLNGRGGPDPSLSPEGRRQASAAGSEVLDLTDDNAPRVITSSMKRAIETGAAIAGGIGVGTQIDADWDSRASVTGMARASPSWPHVTRKSSGASGRTPTTHGPAVRRTTFSNPVCWRPSIGQSQPGGTVVVVSHRKPIVTVLWHVLGIAYDRIWTMAISPASLTSVEVWADRGASVAFVNDTSHLR
jgi:ribonuclease H / adenosylcobalamin/alpha-ribazole phosphatase